MKIRHAIKAAALGSVAAAIPLATSLAGPVTFDNWTNVSGAISIDYATKGLTQVGDAIVDNGFIQVPVEGAGGVMFLTIIDDMGSTKPFKDESFVYFEAGTGLAEKGHIGSTNGSFTQNTLLHTGLFHTSDVNEIELTQNVVDSNTQGTQFTSDFFFAEPTDGQKIIDMSQRVYLYNANDSADTGYADFVFHELEGVATGGAGQDPKHAANPTRNPVTWAAGDTLVYLRIGQDIVQGAGGFSLEELKNENNATRSGNEEIHVHDEFSDVGEVLLFANDTTNLTLTFSNTSAPANPF